MYDGRHVYDGRRVYDGRMSGQKWPKHKKSFILASERPRMVLSVFLECMYLANFWIFDRGFGHFCNPVSGKFSEHFWVFEREPLSIRKDGTKIVPKYSVFLFSRKSV